MNIIWEIMRLTTYTFLCNFVEHKYIYTTDYAAISKRIGCDINECTDIKAKNRR